MKSAIYKVTVEFGDCDPANIVFYPNFFRWINAASNHFLVQAGLTTQRLGDQFGVFAVPIMETGATYLRPATYGDELEIESCVVECTGKAIRVQHRIRRGTELLVEGFEVRFLAVPHPDDPRRMKALQIPDEICAALGYAGQT